MKQFSIVYRIIILFLMIFISGNLSAYDFEVDGLYYNIIASDEVEITYKHQAGWYSGDFEDLRIPETVKYNDVIYKVTAIGDFTFYSCNLTGTLTIPNSITRIGADAFYHCKGLTGPLTIPNSVTTIGASAFYYCEGLTGPLTIPNSVTTIGHRAFSACSGLTGSLTIPNSVTSIGSYAFDGCIGFTGSLTIPNSVTSIGDGVFEFCNFTGCLTIPSSVTSIGERAFESCDFSEVIIPNSVTSIGENAFYWCFSLERVYSDIVTPFSINKNTFLAISYNAILHIPKGTKQLYNQYEGWTCNFSQVLEEGEEEVPSYTLLISAIGNGSASYSGETIRETSKAYTINEGTAATITFTPDNGYRIKSLVVNNTAVTASTSYTVTVNANTSVEVEFEAIPPTTYTLSIKATGNGSATYGNETIKNKTKTFTVNEGTSATITFTPDDGYRIKSLVVDNKAVTASNSYTVTVNANTSVEVEFEAIPATTYTLSIKATGNGSATYGNETIKNTTKTYTVNEGTSATISFTPDDGYRIKSLVVNNVAVTASTSYTVTVNANTTVSVEFEAIPPTTYTLSISASGNGSASYGGETIRGATKTYTVNEGTSATITFTPDNGYRIKSLVVNNAAVTASTSYTVTVNANTTVSVEFEAIPPTTYTLSISASGNGSASYGGETIRGATKTYTVNEGTSATITFTPDNGYRIKSLVVNNAAVTASTSYTVTVNANTTVSVEFEVIPATTYTLSIKVIGNGSASYDGTSIRGTTKSFSINEGTKATITFIPDDGYQIKSLKVNNTAVTASTSYTATINSDTSVEVEFEAKPVDPDIPKTYTLSIRAKGNGIATYNGETIRATTKTYTLEEGTKVSMTFTPDEGNQIKSLRVNGEYQTVTDKYEGTINADTSIKIDFEEIPVDPEPQTTYTLTIKATGNGTATYNGETIRGEEKTYTLEEGTKVSVTFTPDEGNQIKSLKVNGENQTVTDKYEATITTDTSVAVEFEEKPVDPEPQTTYTLTIKAVGNGIASYGEEVIRDETSTFTLDEGTTGTITFTPDEGYHIKSLSVNGSSIDIDNNYSFTMTSDVSVEVVFEVTIVDRDVTIDGLNYEVISFEEHTLFLRAGDYGLTLVIPEKVTYQDEEWSVTGIKEDALDKCEDLAAIIWNPEATFKARVSNPNLLLYVKHNSYAPASIKNVVVNGYARAITLTDAQSGNNFYCPEAFIAQSIVYMHNYSMKTGLNESRGWESIALPFDVQMISHSNKGEITSFANWTSESNTKPFWLYELTGSGFIETESIKANTPYIISMPNNGVYPNDYMLAGRVSFSAINAEVKKSDEVQTATFSNHTFIPSFINLENESGYYALNVNNEFENNQGSDNEGSKFILNLRRIHPFEAYMTSTSGTRSIDIFDGMTTGIKGIEEIVASEKVIKVYDLSGRLVKLGKTMESIKQELPSGVYIINNKKMIIK